MTVLQRNAPVCDLHASAVRIEPEVYDEVTLKRMDLSPVVPIIVAAPLYKHRPTEAQYFERGVTRGHIQYFVCESETNLKPDIYDVPFPRLHCKTQIQHFGNKQKLRCQTSRAMAPSDFEPIWQQVFGSGSRELTTEEHGIERLRHLLPENHDYMAFWRYSADRAKERISKQLNPVITLDELIKAIDTERLLSPAIFTTLTRNMTHLTVPWMPLGCNP